MVVRQLWYKHSFFYARAANHPYFSVFSQKIAPLSTLRKSMRIVRIKSTLTVLHVHCTCAANKLQKFTYRAGYSMVRKNAANYVKILPGYAKRKLEVGSSVMHFYTCTLLTSSLALTSAFASSSIWTIALWPPKLAKCSEVNWDCEVYMHNYVLYKPQ